MKKYVVMFREPSGEIQYGEALAFECEADDLDHATEQCKNAYPEAKMVMSMETGNVQIAKEACEAILKETEGKLSEQDISDVNDSWILALEKAGVDRKITLECHQVVQDYITNHLF